MSNVNLILKTQNSIVYYLKCSAPFKYLYAHADSQLSKVIKRNNNLVVGRALHGDDVTFFINLNLR